jgi:hypothetical protein
MAAASSGGGWPAGFAGLVDREPQDDRDDVINTIRKYVVSNSLQAAQWENTEIISGDVAQKLTDLKAQDGGDIAMSGSPPPSAGCCTRAWWTSSTCSCTRSRSAGAWLGCLPATSRPSPWSSSAPRPFQTGVLSLSYAPIKH